MYDKYLKLETKKNKKIVISTINIPKNSPIIEITGNLYTSKEINAFKNKEEIDAVLQILPDLYIGQSGGITDYINHSCNPNCKISANGRRAILYSIYNIPKNFEITFDYSSTSTDNLDSWQMQCNCGSPNCRKIISGFHLLDKDTQEQYKKNSIAALFIRYPIFKEF